MDMNPNFMALLFGGSYSVYGLLRLSEQSHQWCHIMRPQQCHSPFAVYHFPFGQPFIVEQYIATHGKMWSTGNDLKLQHSTAALSQCNVTQFVSHCIARVNRLWHISIMYTLYMHAHTKSNSPFYSSYTTPCPQAPTNSSTPTRT